MQTHKENVSPYTQEYVLQTKGQPRKRKTSGIQYREKKKETTGIRVRLSPNMTRAQDWSRKLEDARRYVSRNELINYMTNLTTQKIRLRGIS